MVKDHDNATYRFTLAYGSRGTRIHHGREALQQAAGMATGAGSCNELQAWWPEHEATMSCRHVGRSCRHVGRSRKQRAPIISRELWSMKQREWAGSGVRLLIPKCSPNDRLPPVRLHCLNQPKRTTNWEPRVRMLETMGVGHFSNHHNEKLTALYLLLQLGLACRERVLCGDDFLF